ncbi:MAG: hypothetical protein LAP38_16880 [Acidobacteriia bacterium]|nr:hypothetical protein [Terriglobia bacterium]
MFNLADSPTHGFKRPREHYVSALALFAIIGLFVAFSKLAFQSYFSDDDFSNLALARFVPWAETLKGLVSLRFELMVRPAGLLYYKILGSVAHFHFWPYVAVLQAVHIATSLMLWLFLRRLGIRPAAAAVGFLFFALHMSTLPAYWKPMYLFDTLCGFWVIAALLLYQRQRIFLSLLCALFAFKSKEMELMLPAVLLLYEWWFPRNRATSRWMLLIPFFVLSFSFGLQAWMAPKGPESWYTPHLTLGGMWAALLYYGGKLFYVPWAGLVISAGVLFLRQRLVTFGVISFWILLAPMLLFPERHSGVYLYVPLLAFAIVVAAVAESKPWWAVLFLIIWIPASYERLRQERNPILALGHENRPYVAQVLTSLPIPPVPKAVVFEGTPGDFNIWGQEGLFRYVLDKYDLPVFRVDAPEARELIRRPGSVLLTWDISRHRLLRDDYPGDGHAVSYVDFAETNPIWQLKTGWRGLVVSYRWASARSVIRLREPRGDGLFAVDVYLLPNQGENLHQVMRVSSQGRTIVEYRFTKSGFQKFTWPVSSDAEAVKDFEITFDPPFFPTRDSEPLGALIRSIGFLPQSGDAAHAAGHD